MSSPDIESMIATAMEQMQQGNETAALAQFENILAIDPDNAQVLYFKGCALTERGDDEGAVLAFEHSAKYAGELAALPFYNLGNCYQRLGQFPQAMQAFHNATEADPTMADAWINIGRLMDDNGQHQMAIDCYDIAIQIDEEDQVTWSNKGNSHRSLGELDVATECYARSLAIDPNDFAAKVGTAICRVQGGHESGLQDLETIVEQGAPLRVSFDLAFAYGCCGKHEQALQVYDSLVEAGMNEQQLWNNRAESLVKLERIDEAEESFDRAIALAPDWTPALFGKARLLVNTDRVEEAHPVAKMLFAASTDEEKQKPHFAVLFEMFELV